MNEDNENLSQAIGSDCLRTSICLKSLTLEYVFYLLVTSGFQIYLYVSCFISEAIRIISLFVKIIPTIPFRLYIPFRTPSCMGACSSPRNDAFLTEEHPLPHRGTRSFSVWKKRLRIFFRFDVKINSPSGSCGRTAARWRKCESRLTCARLWLAFYRLRFSNRLSGHSKLLMGRTIFFSSSNSCMGRSMP